MCLENIRREKRLIVFHRPIVVGFLRLIIASTNGASCVKYHVEITTTVYDIAHKLPGKRVATNVKKI